MSFAYTVTKGAYHFVFLIIKIIISSLALTLSTLAAAKTRCLVHISFNSTLELINGISIDLQKLLRYFNSTAIVVFLQIPLLLFGKCLA